MGTTGQSITLANSIIGVGILAMPFCFQQCGVLLATVILLFMGLVSRLCCYFLLKSAFLVRRRNFEFLAFHVFGPAGKLAVEIGIIGFLMGTCIAYFVVVGDLGPQIVAKLFNINQSDILRTSIMVIVSLVCVLPLGLLRNVDSLSNVSAATIGFYFCLVMKVIAEATTQLFSSDFKPLSLWKPAGLLQCVPIFSMALFCQTQLFEIFESLPSLSLEKMNVVTKDAINMCQGVYFTLGLFGYMAFGSHNISGNVLMSLSETMASDVIKLGFVMSVAFSFPLIIFPCRASLYSLLYKKFHSSHHDHIINHSIPESSFRCITVAIIAVALFISLLIPNIELVLGLVGSTIGVLVCIVFPAACFINITFKNTNERVLAKGVLMLGLVIMVLGTYANLQAADNQVDKYEDNLTEERIDKIVQDFFQKQRDEEPIHKPIVRDKAKIVPQKEEQVKIVDSAVQPPNPVPPQSNSNEKKAVIEETNKEIIKPKMELEKSSDAHPKNIQPKLNEAKVNVERAEGANFDARSNEITHIDNNISNKIPPKVQEPTLQEKVKDQINYMKHKQLIETIKQHDKEQKELIKEQKQILSEIKKTKDENKDANDEAKKIAVESIQKIANIAIQSLGGVTDKPIDVKSGDKKEPLEVIANEAVQEIAKKAVETIQAIQDTNEVQANKDVKPEKNVIESSLGDINVAHSDEQKLNIQQPQNIDARPNNIVDDTNNFKAKAQALPMMLNGINQVKAELRQNDAIVIPNDKLNVPSNPQKLDKSIDQNVVAPKLIQPEQIVNPEVRNNILQTQSQNVQNLHSQNVINGPNIQKNTDKVAAKQNVQNNEVLVAKTNFDTQKGQVNVKLNEKNVPAKDHLNEQNPVHQMVPAQEHSHSPDEPQSYKQGEDIVKNNEELNMIQNIAQNVPLALAMNGNSQISKGSQGYIAHVEPKNANGENTQNVQKSNNVITNDVNKELPRHKREVDCTEKTALKPTAKEMCEKLLNRVEDANIDVLTSKIDSQNNGENTQNVQKSNNVMTNDDNKELPRHKREVDCTEKTALKPTAKEMCEKLLNRVEDANIDVLTSKIDSHELLNKIPLPLDSVLHHVRTLKSYDTADKR